MIVSTQPLPLCLILAVFCCFSQPAAQCRSDDEQDEADLTSVILLQSSYLMHYGHSDAGTNPRKQDSERESKVEREMGPTQNLGPNLPLTPAQPLPDLPYAAFASAGLVGFLCLVGRSYTRGESKANSAPLFHMGEKPQMLYLDNAKFWLMLCIVLSHADMFFLQHEMNVFITKAWTFNFPLAGFCFISGTLSRGPPSWSKLQSLMMTLFLPFLLYTTVVDAIVIQALRGKSPRMGYVIEQLVNAAPEVAWYLQSLMVWRFLNWFSHLVASRLGIPMWFCFASLSLPLFVASSCVPMHVWSLDHGVAFLPCFAMGLFFPIEQVIAATPMTWPVSIAGLGSLVAWTFLAELVPWAPVKDLHGELIEARVSVTAWSWCPAFAGALLMTTVFMVLLVLACPRHEHWFTKIGREYAIYVYLLHTIALMLYGIATSKIPVLLETQTNHPNLVGISLTFAATILCASPPVVWLFSVVIEPGKCLARLRA